MSSRGLVLAYHAIEAGPAPLFIEPELFARHLDAIARSGTEVLSLDAVAGGLSSGSLPKRWMAITFDDGYASVARTAAPMLAERALPATVFCVASRLGRSNAWPSQPAGVPERPLAGAGELAEIVAAGLAIGSHGADHVRLDQADERGLHREIVESRARLEDEIGVPVAWFAHPYGRAPGPAGMRLVAAAYEGACAMGNRPVRGVPDVHSLPRADAHYLRSPGLLGGTLKGAGTYLALRRLGSRWSPKG